MRRLVLTVVPVLLLACDRAPVAAPSDESPSLNWMNNADGGSMKIFRFEDEFAACWTDARNGLRACHATIPLGGGTEPDCGLQEAAAPGAWQQILIKEDAWEDIDRVHSHFTGDVWITIRDTNNGGECFGNALVAEGWGEATNTDNDIFGTIEPNTNAYGWSARGNLLTPGGDAVKYSGHARLNWRWYPEPSSHASTQVNVK